MLAVELVRLAIFKELEQSWQQKQFLLKRARASSMIINVFAKGILNCDPAVCLISTAMLECFWNRVLWSWTSQPSSVLKV